MARKRRKAQKKKNKKALKAKAHPMSAAKPTRYQREAEYAGPTPELVARLAERGPSCKIALARHCKIITDDQARALEQYRNFRAAKLHLKGQTGALAQYLPDLASSGDSGRIEVMARLYDEGYAAIKRTGNMRAAGQCALVCGGYIWTDRDTLRIGAQALKRVYIDGISRMA